MNIKIIPQKLKGQVVVPPSKSMAHRAIICASLAEGESVVTNLAYSDDIIATIDCMRSLGAKIDKYDDKLIINGCKNSIDSNLIFDCNESGSTLRFMLPIALVKNVGTNKFIGKGKLGTRPMIVYENICKERGIEYIDKSRDNKNNLLDLTTKGKLKSGEYVVDGGISSQFITGLLFALPMLDGDSKIIIKGELQSASYLNLTLSALKEFSIDIVWQDNVFYIKGNQQYKCHDYSIEGDYSQSAFYEVANYLGNDIDILGLNKNSLQGDKAIVNFVARLKNADSSQELVFDGGDCPDIIPVFALACCMRKGTTRIVNVSRLRIKECDRLSATVEELQKLGANIKECNDEMIIEGVEKLSGNVVFSHNDHRMAMMLAVASTVCDGELTLINSQCVSKSYPNFFEHFISLGGKLEKMEEV